MLEDEESKISAKDLATVLAINVDKKAVMKGDSSDAKGKGGVIVVPEVRADE